MVLLWALTSARHLVLPCHRSHRDILVGDTIRFHSCAGCCTVLTETRQDANQLAASLSDACGAIALHRVIPQAGKRSPCTHPRLPPLRDKHSGVAQTHPACLTRQAIAVLHSCKSLQMNPMVPLAKSVLGLDLICCKI